MWLPGEEKTEEDGLDGSPTHKQDRPTTGWFTHQGKREVLSRMTKREMQSSLKVVGNIQKRLYAKSRKKTKEGQAMLRALREQKELEKVKSKLAVGSRFCKYG